MRILSFLVAVLLVSFHGAAGFPKPPGISMRCGYRGTFCYPGICPPGNTYLGLCRLGHSCCRW
ncbi:PREDICTED: gallinacin-4-like [Buceros rhinoceros silvestris]|uniref:gallinacin-4-like n=1 Tax=Buceros rhinoceros silvestris TaxID=175836 RepID=UPI000528AD06|nr:PREDICTED: gallinacin-4-like [Buceros rhinoceros silvestris]